ncbi:diguanylate cyclase [Aquibium sp. LZ166]|uniref:diguanylate cyclase n=1 Tax=Aquibium pacificus TaxID=3153579 RepID=A0ABV3SFM3_9HYPH
MSGPTVTLPMLESYLAETHKRLIFPHALEVLYGQQMETYRQKVMAKGLLPAVIIYNAFLVADLLLLPETALLAVGIHLALVTPIILIVTFLYSKVRRQWLRELTTTVIPFMMVAQIMFIYARNEGAAADQYQYLAVMIVIYMNVNQRFGFRLAVASTLLLMATYLAILLPGHSPFEVKFTGSCLMAAAAYLSLMANRRMEQDVRYNFLRRLRDQLRREGAEEVAKRDALTGLANRRKVDEVVETLWAADRQQDSLVAVVMADIDYFKPFNDRYGHAAGDLCLKRIAGALTTELRNERDLAARLGGEEFLLLLPYTDMSEAVRVAERVRRQIENVAIPHEACGPRGVVTASLGVAAGPVSAHPFTELFASADAALYAAKRNGRNQVWPPFVSKDNPVARLSGESVGEPRTSPLSCRAKAP